MVHRHHRGRYLTREGGDIGLLGFVVGATGRGAELARAPVALRPSKSAQLSALVQEARKATATTIRTAAALDTVYVLPSSSGDGSVWRDEVCASGGGLLARSSARRQTRVGGLRERFRRWRNLVRASRTRCSGGGGPGDKGAAIDWRSLGIRLLVRLGAGTGDAETQSSAVVMPVGVISDGTRRRKQGRSRLLLNGAAGTRTPRVWTPAPVPRIRRCWGCQRWRQG